MPKFGDPNVYASLWMMGRGSFGSPVRKSTFSAPSRSLISLNLEAMVWIASSHVICSHYPDSPLGFVRLTG